MGALLEPKPDLDFQSGLNLVRKSRLTCPLRISPGGLLVPCGCVHSLEWTVGCLTWVSVVGPIEMILSHAWPLWAVPPESWGFM